MRFIRKRTAEKRMYSTPWRRSERQEKEELVCTHQLLLAGDGPRVGPQIFAQLHLDRSAARHDERVADRSPDNAHGIVQRAVALLDELLGPAAEHDRAGLGLRAAPAGSRTAVKGSGRR